MNLVPRSAPTVLLESHALPDPLGVAVIEQVF